MDHGINGHNILGGDFNTVLDSSVDIIGTANHTYYKVEIANKVTEILNILNLIDIWRKNNGNKKRYTWSRKTSKVKSTLDYWFIPCIIKSSVKHIEIINGFGSDHMAVELKLVLQPQVNGPGYWKLNNSYLQNEDYNKGIEKLIKDTTREFKDILNARQLWDLCKNKIRTFSINFAKHNKKEKDRRMVKLEEKMKNLYEKIVANPGDISHTQEYEKVKLEYEILYQYHVKGLIIRSKAKWVEEGERCTKYFMNLEKRNIVENPL